MVSVIVPARNEEANLERCLRTLVTQAGVQFEIVVVDDGSTDGTRKIAESFTRIKRCPGVATGDLSEVRVIDAPALPLGWTGKCNALVEGVRHSRGEWLLFTDADTEHLPGSLTAALKEVQQAKAAMLSYSPEQKLTGFTQKLVMPVIFGELATTYRPREVSNPSSAVAAANGQYILIRRNVYDKVGGHAAVHSELLEDVALARNVKRSGARIVFRLGTGRVRAYMYRNAAEMEQGWTKNLALLFPNAHNLASRRMLEFVALLVLPLLAVADFAFGVRAPGIAAAVASLLVWWRYYGRVSRAH
ncbi:MAG TPA: glycosyltransferase family 2 protein, partial [candidate division Zixibacteria bacterium]|nr:glycosyltransferase family 2 protein [candidate division Zixibacteria bacterium]